MGEDLISFAVTAYNEGERASFRWIRECIQPAVDHPFVSEIVISNDGSKDFPGLCKVLSGVPKVRVSQNKKNLGVFGNKKHVISLCSCEWLLLADSDNVFPKSYLDRLAEIRLCQRVAYLPSFGLPALDYRHIIGRWRLYETEELLRDEHASSFFNTGNQFVNKDFFLQAITAPVEDFHFSQQDYFGAKDRQDPRWRTIYDAGDSFYINKEWLINSGELEVVDGLEYTHGSLTQEHKKIGKSSWEKAPQYKEVLAPAYALELLDAAKNDKIGKYKIHKIRGDEFVFQETHDPRPITIKWPSCEVWRYVS